MHLKNCSDILSHTFSPQKVSSSPVLSVLKGWLDNNIFINESTFLADSTLIYKGIKRVRQLPLQTKILAMRRHDMNTVDRENSILASFLYADDMGTDKSEAFILNEDAFTSSYRRATASKINDETKGDKHYGYLFITIKDLTKGTNFESDYFDIETQGALPLSVINRMHDDLIKEYKNRIIKGLR